MYKVMLMYDWCVEDVDAGQMAVEEVLRRFMDFKNPAVEGALWFDPEWNEPFISSCTRTGLAIGGLCWFPGSRELPGNNGTARIWANTPARNWQQYQSYCNAQARNLLQTFAAEGSVSFVIPLFIGQPEWRIAQRHFRQVNTTLVHQDMRAALENGEVQVFGKHNYGKHGFARVYDEQGRWHIVPTARWSRCCLVCISILFALGAIASLCNLCSDLLK
jgi:hypothetical protein